MLSYCIVIHNIMPCHVMSCHATSRQVMSCHSTPRHVMSCQTTCSDMLSYCTVRYGTVPYHVVPHRTVPHRTVPRRTAPHRTVSQPPSAAQGDERAGDRGPEQDAGVVRGRDQRAAGVSASLPVSRKCSERHAEGGQTTQKAEHISVMFGLVSQSRS